MWKLSLGTILFAAFGALAHAQTQQELLRDGNGGSTDNVLTYGMGYHQQRYSPLKQISKSTIKRLVPVWSASLANEFGEQGQPLVYNGVLYTANVKRVVAIDVATGRQLWTTALEWEPAVARVVCCGLSNRGVALYDGKLFVGSVDAHLRALDANTGKEVWKVKVAEWKEGYSITSAPTVANGVLMTGMTGGEYGVRGFVDGYDPDTGKHLWRRHTTAGPGEKGSETWPAGDAYLRGGGSTWITGSYDPELDLVYWGTSNGGPWTATPRPGDNLWIASVIAFRPKTGEMVWHYQWTPAETYDFDGNNENVLADIMVDGVKRKVLMHADRNGFLYTLDRTNGRLIAANAYVKVNWAERIDLTTARPVETEVAKRLRAGEKVEVRPRWTGGKNWMPMAFNPNTGRLYFAMLDETSVYQLNKELPVYKAGERYMGVENTTAPRTPGEPWGYFGALDPLTAKPKWKLPLTDLPSWSGMLATAGGLVFSGRPTGEFVAIDEDTGNIVWQFKTGSGINAQPITYTHKGRQYVSVLSGLGGGTSAKRETEGKVLPGGSVWTFALMPE
ncbi:MAG TPA: PQQ-dependent dehydrogenase, methanol/ethanol family [Burkholderiales bacterium]|nr:PQQ-dependent dehydrogenase, methanol/ethanol family [Burkholderiales bacterium]